MIVPFNKLDPSAVIPQRMSEHAAGFDLSACLSSPLKLLPGAWEAIPTGLAMEIPIGFEAQIRPRSGLALKHGITVLNSPGTIDADYRGEIKVILINHGKEAFLIEPGMRIAQMVFATAIVADPLEVKELQPSKRDAGGFGHSGH